MNHGHFVVDKAKDPIPLGVPRIFIGGRRLVLVLELFGNAEVGCRCRNGNRKGCQLDLFPVESRLVTWWVIGTLWGVFGPVKVTDGVIVCSYGEELHRIRENLQCLLSVVR